MKNSSLPELVKRLNKAHKDGDKALARTIEAELHSRLDDDALLAFATKPAVPGRSRKDYRYAV